jgi:hypothetical protein
VPERGDVAVRLKSAGAVVAYRLLPISVDPCRGNQYSVMCCSFSIAPGHEIVGDVERCWSGSQGVRGSNPLSSTHETPV